MRLAARAPSNPGPRFSYRELALRQLTDPLVALLAAATAVSAAIGEHAEAVAIGAILAVNSIVGFVEEARAERALVSLDSLRPTTGTVLRDGSARTVGAAEVVPGDLLVLDEGDRVLADARVLRADGLELDESMLTGESAAVGKGPEPVSENTPLAERSSMVHAGTGVTRGAGLAIVTAVGDESELGQVTELAARVKPPPTPLQRRTAQLARLMTLAGVAVTAVVTAGMIARSEPLREAFLVGVSVAIAAVPEGLTATVTVALALGVRAMAKRGAIVRQLPAIETLGATTVICSDKTGTLTENCLALVEIDAVPGTSEDEVLASGLLAGDPRLSGRRGHSDSLLHALHDAARSRLPELLERPNDVSVLDVLPFDSAARLSGAVLATSAGSRALLLGAPETVLARVPEGAERTRIEQRVEQLAGRGLRVLAVAEAIGDGRNAGDAEASPRSSLDDSRRSLLECPLRPIGLLALGDPLRPAASAAIASALKAGIEVHVVTGDHPRTAHAIAAALGLDPALVHARQTPRDKLELVERLQRQGEVVAVTGDGVNDAPALRRAEVGVAMGRSGSEAAREAADIVLTNDDFSTIVAAIEEGRRIGDNIRRVVAFLLSANVGEVALFTIAVLAGLGPPMTVVQLLAVNVLTDGLPALALARDPIDERAMQQGPRPVGLLLGRQLTVALAVGGTLVGLAGLAGFLIGRSSSAGHAQTMAFAAVALGEIVFAYSCRSGRGWRRITVNRTLAVAAILSTIVVAAVVYVPGLQPAFGTVGLDARQLGLVVALALVPAAGVWLARCVLASGKLPHARRRARR